MSNPDNPYSSPETSSDPRSGAERPSGHCPGCGSDALYATRVDASLPGLGFLIWPLKMSTIVCAACGLTRQYAEPEVIRRIVKSRRWRPYA